MFTVFLFFLLVGLSAWKGSQVFQYDSVYEFKVTLNSHEENFVDKSQKYVFYLTDLVKEDFDFDTTKLDVYVKEALFEND